MTQYTLDGIDLQVYGVIVSKGADTLLAYPKRKESINHDFTDVDGDAKDLAQPRFDAREFKLSCSLVADSRTDFKTKYYGLFTALKMPLFRQLYSVDIDQTFYLYFKEQQGIRKLSRKINDTQVGLDFDLIFSETDPGDNIIDVYLVDHNDEFIIG